MDNFDIQLQSIKSQIENMKLQIDNIEMNISFRGEQLFNLAIQMLNTGIQIFFLGKNYTMLSYNNYYPQLKNISDKIDSIINDNNNNIQQQMMQQQMMQQQMMQQQMMQQQMMQQELQNESDTKINIRFYMANGNRINIVCDNGTKIKDVFEKFSNKINKPKHNFFFLCKGENLDLNDNRKIKDINFVGSDYLTITVVEKNIPK